MSSSRIHGNSQTISDRRSNADSSATPFTAGAPRNSPSIFETRVEAIMLAISMALSGGSATARSRSTSTAVPPAPKVITGPKTLSCDTPSNNSRALSRWIIFSMVTPVMRALGWAAATSRIIETQAPRTACADLRFRRTPPTSLLCVISGESIFIATAVPAAAASRSASSTVAALSLRFTGMPQACSNSLDSPLVSMLRPSASACSMMRRAVSASMGWACASGPGVCISKSRLRV